MTLNLVQTAGAALVTFGLGAAALRRSMVGMMIGIQLGAAGLLLIALALFDLSGTEPSTGDVIALAIVAFVVAAAVVAIAMHLAAARANRRAEDLEPW